MTLYLCIYQPASVPYDTALTRKHVQCASFTSWNHTYAPAHGTYSSWQQEVQIPNDFCTLKLVFICIWIILWHCTWRTSACHDKCTAWQVYCMASHDKCTTWRTVQMRVMTSVLHDKCHDKCTAWHLHPEKGLNLLVCLMTLNLYLKMLHYTSWQCTYNSWQLFLPLRTGYTVPTYLHIYCTLVYSSSEQ